MKTKAARKYGANGRGHNAKGRSKRRDRFVKLDHWLQDTDAWQSLGPAPRALYIELARRYNSLNNGEISMSVREAARLLHIAKDTATKAFKELEAKGFIKRNVCGSFNWKLKQATTWILTNYNLGDELATKEFARWRPQKTKDGPNKLTGRPKSGTDGASLKRFLSEIVPRLGPSREIVAIFGPRSRHAYSLPCHAQFSAWCDAAGRLVAGCVENPNIAARPATGQPPINEPMILGPVHGLCR